VVVVVVVDDVGVDVVVVCTTSGCFRIRVNIYRSCGGSFRSGVIVEVRISSFLRVFGSLGFIGAGSLCLSYFSRNCGIKNGFL